MTSPLSKGVRIIGRGDAWKTDIYDLASGEKLERVKAVSIEIDAQTKRYHVHLVMDIPFEYEGPAEIVNPQDDAE